MSQLEKDLTERIVKQGEIVRKLKADKADKEDVTANVQILLDLKAKFKEKLGKDYKPAGGDGGGRSGGGGKNRCWDRWRCLWLLNACRRGEVLMLRLIKLHEEYAPFFKKKSREAKKHN